MVSWRESANLPMNLRSKKYRVKVGSYRYLKRRLGEN